VTFFPTAATLAVALPYEVQFDLPDEILQITLKSSGTGWTAKDDLAKPVGAGRALDEYH
jgi:hypothetical protein